VIAEAVLSVNQPQNSHGYEGRSHSLWFCDAHQEGRFAWYETAFMESPFSHLFRPVDPFSLHPRSASVALSNVVGSTQLAWPFEELDRTDLSEFVDRWIDWFADASGAMMHHPAHMPEKPPANSYRRS
jgi:serine/threonine-protein kinase